jgi:predicted dehydrogenase
MLVEKSKITKGGIVVKVLFFGLGSIGQRHLRNLLRINVCKLEIIAFRTRGRQITLRDDLTVEEGVNLEDKYGIRAVSSISEALSCMPDVVFITNPNSEHIKTLELVLEETSADIFVEKPLGHTLNGLPELAAKAKEKNICVFVGFQNRFHPCIKKAKELLGTKVIGEVMAASIEIGEYMPGFHKYEDYRETYPGIKKLGGGVVLSQIHEIDYAYHFFGMPQSVYASGGTLSHLEIDAEDTASIILNYDRKGKQVPVHIHMDFIQNPPSRKCKIIGTHGKLEFDLLKATIVCYNGNGDIITMESYDSFVRNDMFIEELELFLSIKRGESESILTMEEGMKSLEIALAVKRSMEEKIVVNLV